MNVVVYFFENQPEYVLLRHILSPLFELLKLHFVREENHNRLIKRNYIFCSIFAMIIQDTDLRFTLEEHPL